MIEINSKKNWPLHNCFTSGSVRYRMKGPIESSIKVGVMSMRSPVLTASNVGGLAKSFSTHLQGSFERRLPRKSALLVQKMKFFVY